MVGPDGPPLRARKDDIPQLATHTIARMSNKHRMPAPPLTREDIERLERYVAHPPEKRLQTRQDHFVIVVAPRVSGYVTSTRIATLR